MQLFLFLNADVFIDILTLSWSLSQNVHCWGKPTPDACPRSQWSLVASEPEQLDSAILSYTASNFCGAGRPKITRFRYAGSASGLSAWGQHGAESGVPAGGGIKANLATVAASEDEVDICFATCEAVAIVEASRARSCHCRRLAE